MSLIPLIKSCSWVRAFFSVKYGINERLIAKPIIASGSWIKRWENHNDAILPEIKNNKIVRHIET